MGTSVLDAVKPRPYYTSTRPSGGVDRVWVQVSATRGTHCVRDNNITHNTKHAKPRIIVKLYSSGV
jgi:hypothetical protein